MALVQGKQFALSTVVTTPSRQNKNMTASTTTVDGDQASATTVAATPQATSNAQGQYIGARVNGIGYQVGDGVKTKDCYFSGDGGTTARALEAVVAGDKLYWNGSIAGFQLAASTDKVDFIFDVGP
jgi:hypothetical protein